MGEKTKKQVVGKLGEDVACTFLVKHGFKVVERNYSRRWGEIDVIAKRGGIIHFVEVKAVTRETEFRPEENVHPWKVRRLRRAIQTYFMEQGKASGSYPPWQFDVIAVFLNRETRKAKCRFSENIIL